MVQGNDSFMSFTLGMGHKAVLQALRCSVRNCDEIGGSSLSKVVEGCIKMCVDNTINQGILATTYYIDEVDGSESYFKEFGLSTAPRTLRDIKLSTSTIDNINEIAKHMVGKWAITNNGVMVGEPFEFLDDDSSKIHQVVGTALAMLAFNGFNRHEESITLSAKPRGEHLSEGDWITIHGYLLQLVEKDSGRALEFGLTINFTKQTVSGSIAERGLENEKDRNIDHSEDRESEGYEQSEMDDYDDYEIEL
jgi:hypothetical protein